MSAQTRFCDQCGNSVPSEQSRFCPSCGANVATVSGEPAVDNTGQSVIDQPASQISQQASRQEQILRQFVHQQMASSGLPWNLISAVGNTAILSRRKKVSHLTHFILTVLTVPLLCFWLIIWIIMVVNRKEERRIVEIDLDQEKIIMKGTGLLSRMDEEKWNYVIEHDGTINFKKDWLGSM